MAPKRNALLITGGAGFIGQNFVKHMVAKASNRRIVVLDALTYASNPTLLQPMIESGAIDFVRGDIADRPVVQNLFDRYAIDAVAHLAAESHVDRSIADPDAFVRTNVTGTHVLLGCALAYWSASKAMDSARFLHVSTDEVFGDLGPDDPPFSETSPYRPSSPYSATKASSDHLARAYERTYELPVVITNCSNNYGPCQHPEKLIPLMIIHALEGKPLPIYGDGQNRRDWLFVEDHCRALALALERGEQGQTYAIGGGKELSNIEVVETLCRLIDQAFAADRSLARRFPACPSAANGTVSSLMTFVTDRPGHDRRYAVNCSFAQRSLGYSPSETFETGLARTVGWYLSNEAWWRRALDGGFRDWVNRNYGARVAGNSR
jgi:dTDP-glucose 4,6-dehydratase